LQRLSDQTFSREIGHNYLSRAWLARWREKIPSYIAWQIERETAGWRWHSGEEKLVRDVQSGAETSVRLKGRIDRIDVRPSPSGELEYAVLDYKTQATNGLRKKTAQPYEDAQLPIYALLFGEPIAEMGYVALDQDPVRWLTLDAADLAAANARRLSAIFGELKRGAALPAQGIAQACTYCEMRGLCRKPYWDDA
jgi:ATP-dependent helicase/nuclease subunit B